MITELTKLKGERADTNGYISQLQLRLANLQMMYNQCGKRNCFLENNSISQIEKIEELESEIRKRSGRTPDPSPIRGFEKNRKSLGDP